MITGLAYAINCSIASTFESGKVGWGGMLPVMIVSSFFFVNEEAGTIIRPDRPAVICLFGDRNKIKYNLLDEFLKDGQLGVNIKIFKFERPVNTR
jgi:hypothetical protein